MPVKTCKFALPAARDSFGLERQTFVRLNKYAQLDIALYFVGCRAERKTKRNKTRRVLKVKLRLICVSGFSIKDFQRVGLAWFKQNRVKYNKRYICK